MEIESVDKSDFFRYSEVIIWCKEGVHMTLEAQEYYNIAAWLKEKVGYHDRAKLPSVKRRQILCGEVWYCDLGYNVGSEKNKTRPVLVVSNNRINRAEKVVVVCITDAQGKLNANNLPAQDSWLLLYSNTTDPNKMISPGRTVPPRMCAYPFLDKDSMVQCEEIRAVSKARFDITRGCIGKLVPSDIALLKNKFRRAYDL